MTLALATTPVTDYAIIVDPRDNVAIVKRETAAGLELLLPEEREMRVNSVVTPGHRFATRTIPAGEFVLQYGQPIGTSLGIECGDAITHENMADDVPVIRSEEHTSELQSQSNIVCRLLLEKKKIHSYNIESFIADYSVSVFSSNRCCYTSFSALPLSTSRAHAYVLPCHSVPSI